MSRHSGEIVLEEMADGSFAFAPEGIRKTKPVARAQAEAGDYPFASFGLSLAVGAVFLAITAVFCADFLRPAEQDRLTGPYGYGFMRPEQGIIDVEARHSPALMRAAFPAAHSKPSR